ncbi:MAG TPA: polyhydroxyalkanoate synthesis repressor PhaR [Patescibacteria group bacterium]|jgi:polyhydroxyalkanoate synthesis repressor PhaR|nr:polyhydroxyalkanoate synthesis repressor PhaR [Patescibacteria group bacterium]
MTGAKKRDDKPTVIKKYANRRLYDTGRSSYVTLEDLCQMVKEGREFVVYDAKTNEDLTHAVLTQIIVEQESRGGNLLPIPFLRQLIGFYGDNLQGIVPNYLQQSLEAFTTNQEQFRDQLNKSLGGMMINPVSAMEEINRKNMEMFENAMRAWSPFAAGQSSGQGNAEARLRELKKNIAEMQKEVDRLSGKG